jgi:lipoprotein-anchoring transpeptidase ErfK/SrfK
VGRDGFRWAGLADVGRKVMWPKWTPPKDMIERSPEKAKWASGMPGGYDNPLGARALYLFQNGQDTLYRIHGTTEPMSIGKNASSGCIRMINQDVKELYRRVPTGSRVVVLAEGV